MQGPEHQENLEDEALVHTFDTKVRKMFPAYLDMNRTEFDLYDPAKDDVKRGRLLWFYTEKGRAEEDPKIVFIFIIVGTVLRDTD